MIKINKKEIYYIGFNANNAICNENFFSGSITLYPTKEKGNNFFSSTLLEDTSSDKFLKKYKKYVYDTAKQIQKNNKKAQFICFNDKIKKLCADMNDINFVNTNSKNIIDFLNDKFTIRDCLNSIVPTLNYYFFKNDNLSYEKIVEKMKCKKIVIQGKSGAGGNNTYMIDSKDKFKKYIDLNYEYSVSKYVKHTPLNITLIISKKDILLLPISAQLIKKIDNKFKYVGGDFAYVNFLDELVINTINEYSINIAKKIQKLGYRGILGIDYILIKNKIYFMEINPRFQSSSFLISNELKKYYDTSVAELHYLALNNKKLPKVDIRKINKSFLNCNLIQNFDNLKETDIINNGYFKDNKTSFYRKLFDYSIINLDDFEKEK